MDLSGPSIDVKLKERKKERSKAKNNIFSEDKIRCYLINQKPKIPFFSEDKIRCYLINQKPKIIIFLRTK